MSVASLLERVFGIFVPSVSTAIICLCVLLFLYVWIVAMFRDDHAPPQLRRRDWASCLRELVSASAARQETMPEPGPLRVSVDVEGSSAADLAEQSVPSGTFAALRWDKIEVAEGEFSRSHIDEVLGSLSTETAESNVLMLFEVGSEPVHVLQDGGAASPNFPVRFQEYVQFVLTVAPFSRVRTFLTLLYDHLLVSEMGETVSKILLVAHGLAYHAVHRRASETADTVHVTLCLEAPYFSPRSWWNIMDVARCNDLFRMHVLQVLMQIGPAEESQDAGGVVQETSDFIAIVHSHRFDSIGRGSLVDRSTAEASTGPSLFSIAKQVAGRYKQKSLMLLLQPRDMPDAGVPYVAALFLSESFLGRLKYLVFQK